MTKRIVFGAAVVAFGMFVMAPAASASCAGPRTASTYNFGTGAYNYWHAPSGDTAATGSLVGQSWQLGAPGTWVSTGCTDILYFGAATEGIGLSTDMSTCGSGCPDSGSTLAVLAQKLGNNGTTDFLLATIGETSGASAVNFDFSTQGNHNMIAMPRARVLNSSRGAGVVTLSLAIDSVAGGLYGPSAASAISGFNILSAALPIAQNADAGRLAAAYTPVSSVASPGGAAATTSVNIPCANIANDQWVVVQLQFEGGTVLSDAVGASTRVRCDPTLANPKTPKVKIAPQRTLAH